ncbi:MAG: putative zinc-binding metallopeptidase [Rhizobiaceae bacterium]
MKLFTCPHCSHRLYFENAQCLNCGSLVLYDPGALEFVLSSQRKPCANTTECGCNWVAAPEQLFCTACALNQTIPNLSIDGNRERWIKVEAAKKRAIYTLIAFGLPFAPKSQPGDTAGVAFDFLSPEAGGGPGGAAILTGHENGLITLNVAEADSPERERMRIRMGENYRTLLGHFRHELGHYFWERLIRDDDDRLQAFRATFGDERDDYGAALHRHYSEGAPPDWQQRHISAYAASHPWEDWAETWAHCLHIVDTLEMVDALQLGLPLHQSGAGSSQTVNAPEPPPRDQFEELMQRWLVLSEASNCINRCMGLRDLYPFVISSTVSGKLRFVHDLLVSARPPQPLTL